MAWCMAWGFEVRLENYSFGRVFAILIHDWAQFPRGKHGLVYTVMCSTAWVVRRISAGHNAGGSLAHFYCLLS